MAWTLWFTAVSRTSRMHRYLWIDATQHTTMAINNLWQDSTPATPLLLLADISGWERWHTYWTHKRRLTQFLFYADPLLKFSLPDLFWNWHLLTLSREAWGPRKIPSLKIRLFTAFAWTDFCPFGRSAMPRFNCFKIGLEQTQGLVGIFRGPKAWCA